MTLLFLAHLIRVAAAVPWVVLHSTLGGVVIASQP
jgi:hypothetical protein